MSSPPPKRPPGPPPARPPIGMPNNTPNSNVREIKKPPGPPPNMPISKIKPPPMAPPPASALAQSNNRPGIGNEPIVKTQPSLSAESKNSSPQKPVASQKKGAISMFESSGEAPPQIGPPRGPPPRGPPRGPAPLVGKEQRPAPPNINPPGIPDGQPLPPRAAPPKSLKPPPPVKPPPVHPVLGNRAPPKEEPESKALLKLGLTDQKETAEPPDTEPPLLRIKKARTDEKPLKRREKDMPELESSDEDEDEPEYVKQPLPFGVIKQEIPGIKRRSEEQSKAETTDSMDSKRKEDQSVSSLGSPKAMSQKVIESKKPEKPKTVAPPSRGVNEPKQSGFVPESPAIDIGKHFDDSELGRILPRGRLSIKCIEGIDIRMRDDKNKVPRNDPFIKFRLGVAERLPWKNTETKRKQDGNPQFEDEIVYFDVTDPMQFIYQDDVQLCIELWNSGTLKNTLIGTVTMSVVRFFRQPFVSYNEKVPLYYNGTIRTPMKLNLEIVFEEARSGMVCFTLFEAKGIRNIDPMGRQDPYVQFSLGSLYKKRSKSIKDGGTDPYFEEEQILMWLDQENWVNDLQVDILDEDTKEEKPIASTQFSLLPYFKIHPDDAKEDSYDLFYYVLIDPKDDTERKEVPCGELFMRVQFLPAGKLKFLVDRARGLEFPDNFKKSDNVRMDPYVQLTMEGLAVKTIKRSTVDKDGGSDPVWENEIEFDIVDQYLVDMEVYNQQLAGKDLFLGSAQISLLSVFRNGSTEFWSILKQKKANGGIREVGAIFVKLGFVGPMGISYPQLRPNVDSFDDSLRRLPVTQAEMAKMKEQAELEKIKPAISTIPDEDKEAEALANKRLAELQSSERLFEDKKQQEFSEEEIIAAFKFIDLDHNDFVGAAEIRHILVCMGEMITDEEIDMMISMVDMDGDGQVSFKEFRTLVLHPNPGVVDMHKEISKERDEEILKEKQALAGKTQGLDLTAFQRQKEITQREKLKKMIASFVVDNEADFEYIKQSYLEYVELPKEKRPGGRVRFPEFCKVMRIEPIMEYRKLHAFYDTEEMQDMDLREFLLSMMNFVEVEREERIKFSFEMFDEGKTGYISEREVQEILRGNHMLTIDAVRRKADTIMRQSAAITNDENKRMITLKEFLVISKKFPNILLPSIVNPRTVHESVIKEQEQNRIAQNKVVPTPA